MNSHLVYLIEDLIEMSISYESKPPLNHCEYLSYAWTIFDWKWNICHTICKNGDLFHLEPFLEQEKDQISNDEF